MRWVRLLLIVLAVLVLVPTFLVGIFLARYQFRSLGWHIAHGNHVRMGHSELRLPLMWWRAKDEKDGTIVLDRARFGVGPILPDALMLRPLSATKTVQTDLDVQRILHNLEVQLNRGTKSVRSIVIHARVGKIYCVEDQETAGHLSFAFLYCLSPGQPWYVFFNGTGMAEHEAKGILASMR